MDAWTESHEPGGAVTPWLNMQSEIAVVAVEARLCREDLGQVRRALELGGLVSSASTGSASDAR